MTKQRTRKPKDKGETRGATRRTAIRKMQAAAKAKPKVKAQKATKAKTPDQSLSKSVAGMNRAEGLRLFKVAGRPTREQVILVYGDRGPRWTWDERARAGVPAKKFQAALEEKMGENAGSRPATAKPARTTTQTATLPLAGA